MKIVIKYVNNCCDPKVKSKIKNHRNESIFFYTVTNLINHLCLQPLILLFSLTYLQNSLIITIIVNILNGHRSVCTDAFDIAHMCFI